MSEYPFSSLRFVNDHQEIPENVAEEMNNLGISSEGIKVWTDPNQTSIQNNEDSR